MFDRMRQAKIALHEAEAAHPDSPVLAAVHRHATALVFLAGKRGLLSRVQMDELLTPQGGGTPKTPEPDPE
jgi:hypothetical protein